MERGPWEEDTSPSRWGVPEECNLPPRGWRCTRPAGHDGPCAAVPVAVGLERGMRYGIVPALLLWFAIIAGVVTCSRHGDEDRAMNAQVACERQSPPWATAECKENDHGQP